MKPSALLLGSFSVAAALRFGWPLKTCITLNCIGGQLPHDDDIPENEPSNSGAGFPALEYVPQDVSTVTTTESSPETTSGAVTTSAPPLTGPAAPDCNPILSTRYIQGNQHCGFSPDLSGRPLIATGITSMTSMTSTTSIPPSTSTTTEMGDDGCTITIVYIHIMEVCELIQALRNAPRPSVGSGRFGADLYDSKMAHAIEEDASIIAEYEHLRHPKTGDAPSASTPTGAGGGEPRSGRAAAAA
ncbi:hypothetical protein Cpir12675_005362 [Ceratocystis pirilliformis]|uniref:Uncharacterized protein n=1 Tax=Ceratocystis pirilliformis TaxID=259994 RepID=A0ABR3YQ51_9PEZI